MTKIIYLFVILACGLYSKNEIGRIPAPYNNEYVELEVGPSDVLWAGTWGDGVKKSTDEAESWFNSSNGLTNLYINDLYYNDGILLAATQNGVFKSANEGNSWEEINNGLIYLDIAGVAVKDKDTYFAATKGNGVFRTTDGGATWEEKNNGLDFQEMRFIHITPLGTVLAGKQGDGLMRSEDNGESWQTSQSGIFNKYLLSIKNLPNDEIWISSAGEGIFQSSDDGKHWLRIELLDDLPDLNIESFTYFKYESTYYQIVGTRDKGIWHFDTQWNDPRFLQTVFQWRTAHAIQTLSTGRIVVAIGAEGISYTDTDGLSWNYPKPTHEMYNEDEDLVDAGFHDYKLAADGAKVYAAIGTKGIFKSTDYGRTWENLGEVQDNYPTFKRTGNRLYYIKDDLIRYSANDGGTWNTMTIPDLEIPYEHAGTLRDHRYRDVYHKNNDIFVTYEFIFSYDGEMPPESWNPPAPNNKIYYSSNNGTDWEIIDNMDNEHAYLLSIEATSDGDLFAGTREGKVFKSSNNGADWTETAENVVQDGQSLRFLKANGNSLFASTSNYFYKTINDGTDFDRVDFGLDDALEDFLGYLPSNEVKGMGNVGPNSYFVGLRYNFGVYRTEDNGASFDSINNSFPCEEIRSVANNADGDVYFATTSIWKYANPSKLNPPLLVSPPDRTQNMSITPDETGGRPAAVITWEETEKADIYEIQVSEFEQFYNFMYKKVHAGTSATLTDSLKYNTTYYWRVRSKVNDSYGRWSSRWEFTTELPAPTLIYPDENEIGVPVQPVFTWENINGAENYIVQVSNNLDFQDIVFSETVTSSTFESGTYTSAEVLSPSTQYFWRMKSLSSKSESRWSDYNAFTTVTAPPTLIYPENNAKEIPTELTYKFKGAPNASRYRIQTSSDSTFEDNALRILDRNTETDSTHFFDFLQFFREYYWRVQSILVVDDGQGNDIEYFGEWSETWKFTTGIKPPGLVAPPNNSFDVPLTTKLEWDEFEGAVGYHIQLGLVEDFTNEDGLLVNDTIDGLSYDMQEDILDNYNLYYWRMRVILEDNLAAAWVEPWRFTTIMKQSEQVNPNCDAEDMPLEFTLVWTEVEGGELYRVEVSKTQIFNEANIVFSEEEIDADRIKIESGLEANNTYYWRVQGYNANNTGPWSAVCSFSTEMLSIRDIAKEFNFIAYPNPTSDKMNYEFNLQEASNVTIEIYDLTGVKLATLCDKYLSNGVQNFTWDVKDISNGTYNLVMTVNGKSYIKLVGVSK